MGWFLIEEDADVATVRRAGGVVVGRGATRRGAGAAGGSGGAGCPLARPGVARADRVWLALRGRVAGTSDDSDRAVCALDGGQAAHGLGVRDAGARGRR